MAPSAIAGFRPTPAVLPAADTMPANFHGVRGLHGLVWEWPRDFVASMSGGESRSNGSPDGPLFCGGAASDPNQADAAAGCRARAPSR